VATTLRLHKMMQVTNSVVARRRKRKNDSLGISR
jgi:hypothetical protein